jgi:hypothetical protein
MRRALLCSAALLACLTLAALAAPPAGAQHPNHAQGLRSEHAFQVGGIENVNLFNGNLTLTIPIGPSYPVGPELSYSLTLTYTGNVWEWDEEVDDDGINETYLQAKPRSVSNAGLGWDLSLGRILGANSPANPSPNPVYQSPDQGTHELIDRRLHPNGELFASGNRFSQDSTYLRYKTTTPGVQELNLPNGVKQFFGSDGPTQTIDPFGNYVNVDFTKVDTMGNPIWIITDIHLRNHVVTFGTVSGRKVVTKVELEKFGGGTKAIYTFSYGIRGLPRACNFPQSCTGGNGVCGDTSNASVPVLTQVQLPDTSIYQMPLTEYHLDSSPQCHDRLLNGSLE